MILIIDDDSAVRSSLSFMLNVPDNSALGMFPVPVKRWMLFVLKLRISF